MIEELANGNAAFVDLKVKELDDNQLKDLGHLLLYYGCIVLKRQDLEVKDFSRLVNSFGENQYKLIRDNIIWSQGWLYGDPLYSDDEADVIRRAKELYYSKDNSPKIEHNGVSYGRGIQYQNADDIDYLNPMGWFNSEYPWVQEVSARPKG